MTTTTYFTCTLGQAAELHLQRSETGPLFSTISDLLDQQAAVRPNDVAIGISVPGSGTEKWVGKIYSFSDLRQLSILAADVMAEDMDFKLVSKSRCVALLCSSGIDFVMAWLGLIRAGCSVLLIAPQCHPAAIAHLCKSCQVTYLVHHKSFKELAAASALELDAVVIGLKSRLIPWQANSNQLNISIHKPGTVTTLPSATTRLFSSDPNSMHETAYIHHTSGTSTGLPKPIPQTHYAAVGVLPCLDANNSASFTTTPLYHGGIADCFRAWTSGALIWLFPEAEAPITARNIIFALRAAAETHDRNHLLASVRYFSSVPYVLQMLAEETEALVILRGMDIVGVGGAALPAAVGDFLVKEGVNLISRYGSAELGFLLSSNRDFDRDQEWQCLRLPAGNKCLTFEKQNDESGLFELVVLKGWPYMAKVNREDGSFATRDLFEPHPTIIGGWRYHSRSDSQITLITGKKFDPAPLEEEIVSCSSLIKEVLIFGNGKQRPGAFLFLAEISDVDESAVEEEIWRAIHQVNVKNQSHARISRDLLRIMPKDSALLERSSKGSLLRSIAETRFADEIQSLYQENHDTYGESLPLTLLEEVIKDVRETVNEILYPNKLLDNSDFYHHGVDSGTCSQIRFALQKKFSNYHASLPWNIVYDCGTIERLAQYLMNANTERNNKMHDELQTMQSWVKKYSVFEPMPTSKVCGGYTDYVIVLTGATGMLGSQILQVLKELPSVSQIICLVRAKDLESARDRVFQRLIQNQIELVDQSNKILCWPAALGEADLGLQNDQYSQLKQRATHIIHAAWPVNFSLPLRSFENQIVAIRNLINLAKTSSQPTEFIFCSSTSSVASLPHKIAIPEIESSCPSDANSLGYSRSKWVAEGICSASSKQPGMRGRVKILRVGQLTGDTRTGVWNMTEAWPLMLSTVKALKCLPKLRHKLNWLPVDIAAKVVVDLALGKTSVNEKNDTCAIYHVVNDSSESDWLDLMMWLQSLSDQVFDVVHVKSWLSMLEKLENHPAQQLLGLWRAAYCSDEADNIMQPIFCTKKADSVSQALKTETVNKDLACKIWRWLEGNLV